MGLDNPLHLMFLLVLLLLVFGAKRLPELGQSLGTGLRGFKDAIGGETAPTPSSALAAHTPHPDAPPRAPETTQVTARQLPTREPQEQREPQLQPASER
jgi:sec-independent protein translocase protein TatA